MRILFIGDIVGQPGRRAVARFLPALRAEYAPDVVVANAENAAGGLGATVQVLDGLRALGIDAFTMGNHTWRKKELIGAIGGMPDVVRPANYPEGLPGHGHAAIPLRDGRRLGLVNVLGRIYMEPNACPFRAAEQACTALRAETPVVLVDMHAEATSEKVAMGWHLDGRCTAVVGTHTHVPTADAWLLPGGTAYQSDVGMCGPMHSVIGSRREAVLQKFLTGLPEKFDVAEGPAIFCAVLIDADGASGRATAIRPIVLREESAA